MTVAELTTKELKDYLTINLTLYHAAMFVSKTFQNEFFQNAAIFSETHVKEAEGALLERGISPQICHDIVFDAFMAGAPDLSHDSDGPQEEASSEYSEGAFVSDPIEIISREYEPKPSLLLIEGERGGGS